LWLYKKYARYQRKSEAIQCAKKYNVSLNQSQEKIGTSLHEAYQKEKYIFKDEHPNINPIDPSKAKKYLKRKYGSLWMSFPSKKMGINEKKMCF